MKKMSQCLRGKMMRWVQQSTSHVINTSETIKSAEWDWWMRIVRHLIRVFSDYVNGQMGTQKYLMLREFSWTLLNLSNLFFFWWQNAFHWTHQKLCKTPLLSGARRHWRRCTLAGRTMCTQKHPWTDLLAW